MLLVYLIIALTSHVLIAQVDSVNANFRQPLLRSNNINDGINNLNQFNSLLKYLVETNSYHGYNKYMHIPPFARPQHLIAGPPPPPFPHPLMPRPLPPHLKLLPAYNHSYNVNHVRKTLPLPSYAQKIASYNVTKAQALPNDANEKYKNESKQEAPSYESTSSTKGYSKMPSEIPKSFLYKYRPLKEILQKRTRKGKLQSMLYGNNPYPIEEINGRPKPSPYIEYYLQNVTLKELVENLDKIFGKNKLKPIEYSSTKRTRLESSSKEYEMENKKSSGEYIYENPLNKSEKNAEKKKEKTNKKDSDGYLKPSDENEVKDTKKKHDEYSDGYNDDDKKVSLKKKKKSYFKEERIPKMNYYFDTNVPTEYDKEDLYDKLDLFLQKSMESKEKARSEDKNSGYEKNGEKDSKDSKDKADKQEEKDTLDNYYQPDEDYYSA